MSCCSSIPGGHRTVVSGDTTGTVFPMTPWRKAIGAQTARARIELTEPTSALRVIPVYQTAASDTDDPDSWTAFTGSAIGGSGDENATWDVDLSTATDAKWFIRFGVKASNSTGTTYESGDLTFEVGVSTD